MWRGYRAITRVSFSAAACALLLLFVCGGAWAKELKAGDVINKDNLDAVLQDTFEGHTIDSMLPGPAKMLIRDYGLEMTLRHFEPVPRNEDSLQLAEWNEKNVTFDAEANTVRNYYAGPPFPYLAYGYEGDKELDMEDPNFALKVMWMYYLNGYRMTTNAILPDMKYLFIDVGKGIERTQQWTYRKVYMAGGYDPYAIDEPNQKLFQDYDVESKSIVMATAPYDVKGVGTYSETPTGPKMPNTWVYVRSVRRIRRLAGGGWYDPVGGTDQLSDELNVINAHPSWYPKYKILGKTWVLGIAHTRMPIWDAENDTYPVYDTSHAPYFLPVNDWEPRPCYIMEITLPDAHPYKRRVVYMDRDFWYNHWGFSYDKRDELAKIQNFAHCCAVGEDSSYDDSPVRGKANNAPMTMGGGGFVWDIKRNHATISVSDMSGLILNDPELDPSDVSVQVMKKLASGQITPYDY